VHLLHLLRRDVWDYCWALGVPGNVVATPVIAILAVAGDRLFLRKTRKRRHQLVEETHRLLHNLHPEAAAALGHDIPPPKETA
jgi:hypothetical protein